MKTVESVLRPRLWFAGGWWHCGVREGGVTFQQVSSISPESAYAYWLSQRPAWVQRAVLARFPSLTRKVMIFSPGFLS